jgi:hypothetical protein
MVSKSEFTLEYKTLAKHFKSELTDKHIDYLYDCLDKNLKKEILSRAVKKVIAEVVYSSNLFGDLCKQISLLNEADTSIPEHLQGTEYFVFFEEKEYPAGIFYDETYLRTTRKFAQIKAKSESKWVACTNISKDELLFLKTGYVVEFNKPQKIF